MAKKIDIIVSLEYQAEFVARYDEPAHLAFLWG
jgi:hypothetical protein